MDVETAGHNYKETQNCSRVLDKSRKIETADYDYKETQNCSRVLDKSRKVETHPSSLTGVKRLEINTFFVVKTI